MQADDHCRHSNEAADAVPLYERQGLCCVEDCLEHLQAQHLSRTCTGQA